MVAFKLLDKAMSQLARQREFGAHFTCLEPSMTTMAATCSNMQQKSQSQPGVTVQALAPRSPLKSKKITWAPGLELLGGKYEPWSVSQPKKPILKTQEEYAEEAGFMTQEKHWSERSEALTLPARMTTSASNKPTCIKLLTKKRTREVAFSD